MARSNRCIVRVAPSDALARLTLAFASTATVLACLVLMLLSAQPASAQSSVRPPDNATRNALPSPGGERQFPGRSSMPETKPVDGNVPGAPLGNRSQSDLWRALREGRSGNVSIPDKNAGQLIRAAPERLQSLEEIRTATRQANRVDAVDAWVEVRRGPIATYGSYAIGGTLVFLALFFLIRGRIRIEHGWSGRLIQRFSSIERIGHWLLAISFIVLALTGLNLLYGREALIPLIGGEAYAAVAYFGKLTHNYVAFAFMAGLLLIFVNWVRYNIPHPRDLIWLAKGGGLFTTGVHPSSKKFNAGQKIIFWLVILGGASLSLSGIALMFPFQTAMFAKTFVFLNAFGFDLPTALSPIDEMKLQALWHSVMALFLVCVVLAHIYIGSIGMEGAIDAVTTGQVDESWAREHHDLWVEEVHAAQREAAAPGTARAEPAE